jgi:hypothetical protein
MLVLKLAYRIHGIFLEPCSKFCINPRKYSLHKQCKPSFRIYKPFWLPDSSKLGFLNIFLVGVLEFSHFNNF